MSARKNRDKAAQRLLAEDWAPISGFLSGRGGMFVKKKSKPKSNKSTTKAKKGPAVRSTKKLNVWR